MKALIGRKLGMTQVFGERGKTVPVTLVQAGPCVITQLRSVDKDGYSAVQLGFGDAKKLKKPQMGHLKPSSTQSTYLREIRLDKDADFKVGDKLDVSQFEAGQQVKITAISKGKGFAGTIKRWNFHRGPTTHGSDNHRQPGSIGSMYPQKVFKGKKMAGRMGHAQVSVRNLKIAEVDTAANLIAINGAVPGPRRGLVIIKGL